MILDSNLKMVDGVDVSASTGTALVGDVIDLSSNAVNPARGEPLYLIITVTTGFTTGSTSEAQFKLASDASASIATNGTATEHVITPAYDTGDLPAGTRLVYSVPQAQDFERYLGLLVVTSSAATTAGTITAEITAYAPQDWHSYPDAVN